MKHLLDVNVLLAAIWKHHSRHNEVFAWLPGKSLVVCPPSGLPASLAVSPIKRTLITVPVKIPAPQGRPLSYVGIAVSP